MQEILFDGYGNGRGFRGVNKGMLAKICSADFHGAEIEVVRSRCVSRVGVKGIVVKDSRGVFEVVAKSDGLKILPKEGTVFRFTIPLPVSINVAQEEKKYGESETEVKDTKDLVFELYGEQFQYRAADRANRKFKSHFLPDI